MAEPPDDVKATPTDRRLSPLFTWRSAVVESALPPTQRHVALTLSLHMNERGGSCFPTHDQLVDETGLGRSTVVRALGALEKGGWLLRLKGGGRRRGGAGGRATTYTATVPQRDGTDGDTVPLRADSVPLAPPNSPAAGHQDVMKDDILGRHEEHAAVPATERLDPEKAPPLVKIDGQNLPLNRLCEVTGIDRAIDAPGVKEAVGALNGPRGRGGIRQLAWAELVAWAVEHGRADELADRLRADPARLEEAMANQVVRKAAVYAAKMPGMTLTPGALLKWWVRLERLPSSSRGLTPDQIARGEY